MALTVTVGYVSGIIAAGIFILQFFLPNALITILVSRLKNEHTTVTWSVVERNLQSSFWPLFLSTDSAASKGVDRWVRMITWVRPIGLGIIAIAAVVTPLGLYEDIVAGKHPQLMPMIYVQDTGPMGYGTPPRSSEGFTRSCGDWAPMQCPGSTVEIDYQMNGSFITSANISNDDYDVRIPEVLADLYQSGLINRPRSVSSYFDIQSRQYTYKTQKGVGHGGRYIISAYDYLSSMVLNNAIEPVEGLIVDTVNGGIGFRNHTVPAGIDIGTEWSEDLLWLEPETACVNTNISVEFKIPRWSRSIFHLENVSLIDEGGFANLEHDYPRFDIYHSQENPRLRERAYKAAWMTNAFAMLYMNITRPSPNPFAYVSSQVGQRWPTDVTITRGISLSGITMSSDFQSMLTPSSLSNSSLIPHATINYTNPFNIGWSNYSDITVLCSGVGGRDLTNLTNIHVRCGLVFGAASRQDGLQTLVIEPGTWYTQPIYSCASTIKASLKTVTFHYNATKDIGHSLKSLHIVSVVPKSYSTNGSSGEDSDSALPLWGVEDVPFALHDLTQLWGLIDPDDDKYSKAINLSTRRAPHLYLPGFVLGGMSAAIPDYQFMPGTSLPAKTLASVYDISSGLMTEFVDYSGRHNAAMKKRWRDLTSSKSTEGGSQGVERLLAMIWTDFAAQNMCGTRSWNSGSRTPGNLQRRADPTTAPQGEDSSVQIPVIVYQKQIRYHWPFAIPGIVVLALVASILIGTLVSLFTGRGSPSRIKHYLYHLSAGRLIGAMQYAGLCEMHSPTKEWIARVGRRTSNLRKGQREDRNSANGTTYCDNYIESTGPQEKLMGFTSQIEIPQDRILGVSDRPLIFNEEPLTRNTRNGYEQVSTKEGQQFDNYCGIAR